MGKLFTVIVALIVIIFVIAGAFMLIGAVFSLTFGILGALIGFLWRLVFNPICLIIIIGYIIYRYNRRHS